MFKNTCYSLFVILIDNEKLKISKKKLLKQAAESGKSQTLTKEKKYSKIFFRNGPLVLFFYLSSKCEFIWHTHINNSY